MSDTIIQQHPGEDIAIIAPDWTFRYPHNCILLEWDKIQMDDRSRKDFGNIEELAMSIRKNGLIHPPTVTMNENYKDDLPGTAKEFILVGGERRMRAMKMLEVQHFPVNIRELLPHHEVLELELMENFHRKQMHWQEQCVLISKTHKEKVRVNALDSKSWGVRETGFLLAVSAAHISHATLLAPLLLAGDAELLAAGNMFAAYEILLRRKENAAADMAVATLNERARRDVVAGGGIRGTTDDTDEIFGEVLDPVIKTYGGDVEINEFLGIDNSAGKLNYNLTEMFAIGDCLEYMKTMSDECVDHVVTDPPYGIDLKQMAEMKNIDSVMDTHEVHQNIEMFEPFLREAFRITKPNGYVVFWYDLDHHEKLQALGHAIGFKVQRWPVIWHKLHPCKNASPRINFTKNFEVAMVFRKSINAALTEPQTSCIFTADGQGDRKLYDNPFSKPLAAWKFILSAISYRGQTIFDAYAGQMSCARACINMGLVPRGCEIDPDHYNKGIVQLTKLIKEINGQ